MSNDVPRNHAQAVALFRQRTEELVKASQDYESKKDSMTDKKRVEVLNSLNDAEASLDKLEKYNKANGEFRKLYAEYTKLSKEGVIPLATKVSLLEKFLGLFQTIETMRREV